LKVTDSQAIDLRSHLRQLLEIGIALSHERDLFRLLDKILLLSRRFTRAEAGTLYVREKKEMLRFVCVQNEAMPSSDVTAGSGGGSSIPISRTSIAGYVASTGDVLNIPDVYEMPSDVEYSFNQGFDQRSGYRTQSMLVAPMVEPDGQVIGVLQLINARDKTGARVAFPEDIEEYIRSLASQAAVALENANLTRELKRVYEETVMRLARAAEYRDTDTGEHIRRMSHYSKEISKHLGFTEDQQTELLLAAPMHDIGKLAIADAILKKPGKLTPEEYAEMQRHTIYGGEILQGSDAPILQLSEVIALTHHEKWDGTGYPHGLKGDAIHIAGRITACADVYDALSSKRVYKDAMPLEESRRRIIEGSGTHFDPSVIAAFEKAYDQILRIREKYSS